MPLNFGGQKRSGAFDMVWPPANMGIKEIMTFGTGKKVERLIANGNTSNDMISMVNSFLPCLATEGQTQMGNDDSWGQAKC